MIQAITFDFWDTIVRDDSDELKRAVQGMGTKAEARFQSLVREIRRHHSHIPDEDIKTALEQANEKFRCCWKEEHHTPKVKERITWVYQHLSIEPTPGFSDIVTTWERMEIITPPDLADGVQDMLAELSQHYALGIISDTIVTPGWGLHQILQSYGLLQYFRVFIFSDEVGSSKPHRQVFEEASRRFGVPLANMAHVGDRETNDVTGPHHAGALSILYTGVIDRGHQSTKANAVCHHYRELPALVASLPRKLVPMNSNPKSAAIQTLGDLFIKKFPETRDGLRQLGREAEYPVVNAEGFAADVQKLWPLLQEGGDLKPTLEGDMIVTLEGQEYSYSLEVGWGTMEVITRPCRTLQELEDVHQTAFRRLCQAADAFGYNVLGYGIQPRTPGSLDLLSPKKRYKVLYDTIGKTWLHFTCTASDQVQIDLKRSEIPLMHNTCNVMTPALVALCANSPIAAGQPTGFCSGREGFMGEIYAHEYRHGMPAGPIQSIHDWIEQLCEQRHLMHRKDGKYLPQQGRFVDFLAQHGPDFEAFLFHEHYIWNSARLRSAHGTLEFRSACQQPHHEHASVAALSLGLLEAAPDISQWLQQQWGDQVWPTLREYGHQVMRQGLAAPEPTADFLQTTLRFCEQALERRKQGEARYLQPLWTRLQERKNPAQRALESFQSGGFPVLLRLIGHRA